MKVLLKVKKPHLYVFSYVQKSSLIIFFRICICTMCIINYRAEKRDDVIVL